MYNFTDTEIKLLLKNIVIVVDTAEKDNHNDHILDWFDKKKHKYIKRKLPFGDYSGYVESNEETKKIIGDRHLWFNRDISVERKANLTELAGNLKQKTGTEERKRIENEFMKAKLNGCYMPMFVEDANGIQNIFKKSYGKPTTNGYETNYLPNAFYGSIKGFEAKFNYITGWYSKEMMGHEIYNTIYYNIRAKLKTM